MSARERCDAGRRAMFGADRCDVSPARHVLHFVDDRGQVTGLGGAPFRFCDRHMAELIVAGLVDWPNTTDPALAREVDRAMREVGK